MKLSKNITLLVVPFVLVGCSSFQLSESPLTLSVKKQRRAKDSVCIVKAFTYETTKMDSSDQQTKDDEDGMTKQDLDKWQELLVNGLNQSNIFADVILDKAAKSTDNEDYLIDGRIKHFYFKKNWVPTFFPGHIALSLFTLTVYTWAAGPTTVTKVEFEVEVNLRDAKTNKIFDTFTEHYTDTSALNIYSKGLNNPYENPGLVFTTVIDSIATKIGAALPH